MSKLLAGVLTLSIIVVAVRLYPNSPALDTSFDQATTWLYDRWTGNQRGLLQDIKECSLTVWTVSLACICGLRSVHGAQILMFRLLFRMTPLTV